VLFHSVSDSLFNNEPINNKPTKTKQAKQEKLFEFSRNELDD